MSKYRNSSHNDHGLTYDSDGSGQLYGMQEFAPEKEPPVFREMLLDWQLNLGMAGQLQNLNSPEQMLSFLGVGNGSGITPQMRQDWLDMQLGVATPESRQTG